MQPSIKRDNQTQNECVKAMKPTSALLKCRFEYPPKKPGECKTAKYLKGKFKFQSFNGPTSTESRVHLVDATKVEEAFYNVEKYQNQMFYHNVFQRQQEIDHKYADPSIGIEKSFDFYNACLIIEHYYKAVKKLKPEEITVTLVQNTMKSLMNRFPPKHNYNKHGNLQITNVPSHYTEDNLRQLFDEFGHIVKCSVLKDDSGHSRGVGFVRMDTHHIAIAALNALDSQQPDPTSLPISVKVEYFIAVLFLFLFNFYFYFYFYFVGFFT